MTNVCCIVEGAGEVAALPVLLRRIHDWLTPALPFPRILAPIKVARDRFLNRPDEFSRHALLAAAKCGDDGWILLLLDADDDCPARLGADLVARLGAAVPHRRSGVVLANREFEAWFIAAAASLAGCRGFQLGPQPVPPAETPRDAKGWVNERMPRRAYGPTTDQPALAAKIDLRMAHANSRSFRKLTSEWLRHMGADPAAETAA